MKIYTEIEITESLESMGLELMVNDFFQMSEPIELPSDEDIEEGSRNYIKGTDLDTFVERTFFKSGAKWMKEQILNQNK